MHDSYYIIPAVHVQKISKSFDIFCANKGFEMYHNMQGAAKCPSEGTLDLVCCSLAARKWLLVSSHLPLVVSLALCWHQPLFSFHVVFGARK